MKLEKCRVCDGSIPQGRSALGYRVCLDRFDVMRSLQSRLVPQAPKPIVLMFKERRNK
jgi:hypothetical protein